MCQQRLRMIVGLGNPGDAYAATRHNSGVMVVDHVADAYTIPFQRKKFDATFGRGVIERIAVILVKPLAYMNRSGFPVRNIADYFKISLRDMLVIHDDIDLEFGRLKIKQKGGDGGHKGLKSMIDAFGGRDFTRLRIGIGRGDPNISVTDHVLGSFNAQETEILKQIMERAQETVVTILSKGTSEGMNRFNDKRITVKS